MTLMVLNIGDANLQTIGLLRLKASDWKL